MQPILGYGAVTCNTTIGFMVSYEYQAQTVDIGYSFGRHVAGRRDRSAYSPACGISSVCGSAYLFRYSEFFQCRLQRYLSVCWGSRSSVSAVLARIDGFESIYRSVRTLALPDFVPERGDDVHGFNLLSSGARQ